MAKKPLIKKPVKKLAPKKPDPKKHPLNALKKVASTAAKKTATVTKKVGKNVVKVGKKVGKVVLKSAEWTTLMPFKILMLQSLKHHKVNVSKHASLKTIACLFYVNVIGKKTHKSLEHLTIHEDVDNAETAAFQAASLLAKNSGVPGADISVSIIHKIIDYFKANQKKKKNEKAKSKIDTLDQEIKEAEAKGETELVSKLMAEKKELQNEIEPLTTEEKKAHGEVPGSPDAPLTQQEKDEADKTDKITDAIAEVTPGTQNTKGEVVNESKGSDKDNEDRIEHKKHGVMKFFSFGG